MAGFEALDAGLGTAAVLEQTQAANPFEAEETERQSGFIVDERVLVTEAGVFACKRSAGCNNRAGCVAAQACTPKS